MWRTYTVYAIFSLQRLHCNAALQCVCVCVCVCVGGGGGGGAMYVHARVCVCASVLILFCHKFVLVRVCVVLFCSLWFLFFLLYCFGFNARQYTLFGIGVNWFLQSAENKSKGCYVVSKINGMQLHQHCFIYNEKAVCLQKSLHNDSSNRLDHCICENTVQ